MKTRGLRHRHRLRQRLVQDRRHRQADRLRLLARHRRLAGQLQRHLRRPPHRQASPSATATGRWPTPAASPSRPTGDNPNDYDAEYYAVDLGLKTPSSASCSALATRVLGSDDGNFAFRTPLATLHKFNGFADVFLVTPNDGLEDIYVYYGFAFPKEWKLKGKMVYHFFNTESQRRTGRRDRRRGSPTRSPTTCRSSRSPCSMASTPTSPTATRSRST